MPSPQLECGGKCCVGDVVGNDVCYIFTGKVCKDGMSCMGGYACREGNIQQVVNSCNGYKACAYAGRMGVVESMVSSCYGELACDGLGSKVRVGTLNKACVGY